MDNTKERPIILTAQEVNAVLAGDKAQHRAPVLTTEQSKEGFEWSMGGSGGDNAVFVKGVDVERSELLVKPCPFGAIGDRLWVRETHHVPDFLHDYEQDELARGLITRDSLGMSYKADAPHMTPADGGWTSPVAMPRWASRLLLEITDIRIERIQDISESDAIAEGIKYIHADPKDRVGPNHFTKSNGWYHCSRPTAAEVFTEMYGVSDDFDKYGENPWVWVIEFKEIKESNHG